MCMNAQCIKKIYTKKIVNKYPYFVLLQFLMHQPLQHAYLNALSSWIKKWLYCWSINKVKIILILGAVIALNPALTYHYCAIFPALEQYGTECVLDPELSWCCLRKEVDLTKKCDSSSITWVTNGCTAKYRGESLGGEREEVGLRHSSEEQTNGIGLLILKKNMAMLCVRMLLLLFYNSSLHHHHYDCNPIGLKKICQK